MSKRTFVANLVYLFLSLLSIKRVYTLFLGENYLLVSASYE